MKRVRDSIKLLRYNLKAIVVFEILYKVIAYSVMVPFLLWLFNFSIKCAGISFLGRNTINNYFKAPTTWIFILLVLLILAAILLVNISGVIYAMEASNRTKKISALNMLVKGARNAIRIFKIKNIWMFLYVLIFLPITNTTMVSATLIGAKLPEYVMTFFRKNWIAVFVISIVYIGLCIYGLLYIFSLNYFTLKKESFSKAISDSRKCIKDEKIKTIFGILIWNILMTVIIILLDGIISGVIMAIVKKIVTYKAVYFAIDTVIQSVSTMSYLIFSVLVLPLTYAYICNSYYNIEDDDCSEEDNIDNYKYYDPVKNRMKERAIVILIILIALVLDVSYIILRNNSIINLNAEYMNSVTVAAHRGDSINAPENTLAAFEKAIENQADVIELDVRQTKDGEIVVVHDESLLRTVGINKRVGELTYDEILKYDAGSWFSPGYSNEKVPTLVETIELVDGRADLNIEVKPAKTDTNLVESVVEIVNEYDLYDSCVVTSPDYDVIRRVKQLDDRIKTVFVTSVAFGDIYDLKYADALSVKYTFITTELVKEAHKRGKEVYAWTINSDMILSEMMLRGVDCVITDNPYHTKKVMYGNTEGILSSVMHKYFGSWW